MVVSIIVASMESRASRRSYALFLLQLNLIFSPFLLLLVLLSSFLSAPLLPLFTLPVFFVSFPRPASFWPGVVNHQQEGSSSLSSDSQLYKRASRGVAEAVCSACRAAAISLSPGSIFLLRHEDKLMWVQVLEAGNNYHIVSVKGLELQETSCHSLEATRLVFPVLCVVMATAIHWASFA